MHTTAKVIKIAALCVSITVLVLLTVWKLTADKPLLPDRAPSSVESEAVLDHGDGTKLQPPISGGGGSSLSYTKEIDIDLKQRTASLYFENGTSSLYDAAIYLVVQDTVVLQSGLLPPGSSVHSLSLPTGEFPLQQGSYDARMHVQFFNDAGDPLFVNSVLEGFVIDVT